MANCVLPEDIIVCILTRLPVKSIIRFKSVCKPWLSLFSSPRFLNLHRSQFSRDPKNQSLIWYNYFYPNNIYLLNHTPKIELPSPIKNRYSYVLGCCNGLICITSPQARGDLIVLWNPATKMYKPRLFKKVAFTTTESLGFGYDSERDDYKLVRITGSRPHKGVYSQKVEVYSFNSDSCTTVHEVGFQITKPHHNAVVVNGNPYWFTHVDDDKKFVLFCCDVTNLVCKIVPMLPIFVERIVQPEEARFVDWNGELGALECRDEFNGETYATVVDVWVFDDVVQNWRHKHSFGPVQECVHILQCLKNGNMVGYDSNYQSFLFDPANGCVEAIELLDKPPLLISLIFDYTESLTHIDGMIPNNCLAKEVIKGATKAWDTSGGGRGRGRGRGSAL